MLEIKPIKEINLIPAVKTSKLEECFYRKLELNGAPILDQIRFMEGYRLSGKINKWLKKNWTTETTVTRELVRLLTDYRAGEIKSIKVRNHAASLVMTGVLQFVSENEDALSQLIPIYFPDLTLAGTPVPKISKAFNEMSFIERQQILRANNSGRLEEVKDN